MFPSVSNPLIDANVGRILDETVAAVNEVDNRLQTLKIGLVQAFPQLAPPLLARETLAAPFGRVPNAFAPFAHVGQIPQVGQLPGLSPWSAYNPMMQHGAPFTGIGNVAPSIPYAHIGAPPLGVPSPYGLSFGPQTGVTHPFPGMGIPFRSF